MMKGIGTNGITRPGSFALALGMGVIIVIGAIKGPRLLAQPDASVNIKPSAPRFEVASIRPARNFQEAMQAGLKPRMGITANAARVDIGYWSILQLIVKAYGIQPYQLIGPDWMGSVRFDVQATLPQGATPQQVPEMLRWMLVERFALAAHAGTKELPGYALKVGKGGPKMKPAPSDSGTDSNDAAGHEEEANTLDLLWGSGANKPFGLAAFSPTANGDLHMQFQKLPMPVLAQILASYARAPVEDVTSLVGKYQVTLDFSPTAAQFPNPAVGSGDSGGNDLFTAVKWLGLELVRRPVRCAVVIVDHVERVPTAN